MRGSLAVGVALVLLADPVVFAVPLLVHVIVASVGYVDHTAFLVVFAGFDIVPLLA